MHPVTKYNAKTPSKGCSLTCTVNITLLMKVRRSFRIPYTIIQQTILISKTSCLPEKEASLNNQVKNNSPEKQLNL